MTSSKIKRLLFDADNTLFDFNQAEDNALRLTLAHFGFAEPPGLMAFYRDMNVRLWQRFDAKQISIQELKTQRTSALFEFIGGRTDPEAFSHQYLQALSTQQCLLPGVTEGLAQLSQHCEMGIITNGLAQVQNPRFERSPIKSHFKTLVISEEVGAAKPDPEIFHLTCARMGWEDPSAVMMVGDNHRCDVLGASAVGMQTCWFNVHQTDHDLTGHDHEIRHFSELLGVLGLG